MNGVLLTASGIIIQSSGGDRISGLGVAVLAVAGAIFCGAWRSLIISFGQLNSGKFQVINAIERHLLTISKPNDRLLSSAILAKRRPR